MNTVTLKVDLPGQKKRWHVFLEPAENYSSVSQDAEPGLFRVKIRELKPGEDAKNVKPRAYSTNGRRYQFFSLYEVMAMIDVKVRRDLKYKFPKSLHVALMKAKQRVQYFGGGKLLNTWTLCEAFPQDGIWHTRIGRVEKVVPLSDLKILEAPA
ncbi:MAG: hypothetical protein JEY71_10415 [Sphaerochaeta sp.]|nr:hypothetical protein [Sphaerochaeta sp.]